MFPETLESERLDFERLTRDTVDLFALYELLGSGPNVDAVFEYLDERPHRTIKTTFEKICRAEQNFSEGNSAQYVIRPKASEDHAGEIVGVTGIYPKWDRRLATLGIILAKRAWGNGYSAERAAVMLDLAFDRLDLDVVAVLFIDGNEKSRRAVEKYVDQCNGRYEGLLRHRIAVEGDVYDCHRYSISREEYADAREDRGSSA